MARRNIFTLLSVIVVFCFVIVLIIAFGTLVISREASAYHQTTILPPPPILKEFPSPGGDDLPSEVSRRLDEIENQVSTITGLPRLRAVPRSLLSPTELRNRVEKDFFVDYPTEEIRGDSALYHILGLLPPDYDLKMLLVDLYSEQISGYYDPETKEMFVVKSTGFSGVEQMTYAHEFTHALQDQAYDLRQGLHLRPDYCKKESEYCTAVTALIEGDAVLTEQIWLSRYATPQVRSDIQDFAFSFKSPILDSAPLFIREDLLFPYRQGLEFAGTLFDKGGREALNSAFLSPPVSSEQVLHPNLYPQEKSSEIILPDIQSLLGAPWELIDQNILGEWAVSLILSSGWEEDLRLSPPIAKKAASGWAGSSYQFLRGASRNEDILLVQVNFDSSAEAEEFWQAFSSYGRKRWGSQSLQENNNSLVWTDTPEGNITCIIKETRFVWVIAPSSVLMQKILSYLPGIMP